MDQDPQMTPVTFWFDPVSPYALLAFEQLPRMLQNHSVVVDYKPVLFGALLSHHQHKGPAEIEPKRQWTFRQVAWLARNLGVRLDLPAQHPFNPLPLLRLLLATAGPLGLPNRRQVEQVFHHVWHGGLDPVDGTRLKALESALLQAEPAGAGDPPSVGLPPEPNADGVKARLRGLTQEAIDRGIFGVPTCECQGRLFWGLDALPMLQACLSGDPWFEKGWDKAAQPVPGISRR